MSKLRKGQSLTHPQNIALAWMARNGGTASRVGPNSKWTIGPGREWVHLVMVSLEKLGRVRFTDHGIANGDGRPFPREAVLVK